MVTNKSVLPMMSNTATTVVPDPQVSLGDGHQLTNPSDRI